METIKINELLGSEDALNNNDYIAVYKNNAPGTEKTRKIKLQKLEAYMSTLLTSTTVITNNISKTIVNNTSVFEHNDMNDVVPTKDRQILLSTSGNMGISDDTIDEIIDSRISSGVTYNTNLGSLQMATAVGGYSIGTTANELKSRSFTRIVDDLLFPTIDAVYTSPTITMTIEGTSTVIAEEGSSLTVDLVATFTQNDAGVLDTNPYQFKKNGANLGVAQSSASYSEAVTVASGNTTYNVEATHLIGDQKQNNKGDDSGSPISAGTISSSVRTLTGILPYYYYKSSSSISAAQMATAINDGSATKVVSDSTGTLSIPYSLSGEYIAIAYPNASTTKTKYYVTDLDQGNITLVFDAVTTQSATEENDYWTSETYKIHTSTNAITNSNTTIELRNS